MVSMTKIIERPMRLMRICVAKDSRLRSSPVERPVAASPPQATMVRAPNQESRSTAAYMQSCIKGAFHASCCSAFLKSL